MLPDKTIYVFPMREAKDYRRTLTAIDDALVVVRRSGDFLFELRPLAKLGPRNCIAQLIGLAEALKANHHLVVIESEPFFAELIAMATKSANARQLPEVEAAALTVAERSRYQVIDYMQADDIQQQVIRRLVAARLRMTAVERNQPNNYNYRNGIPVPRSEQMWNTFANTALDTRDGQAAVLAWQRWVDANRPDMPRHDR